MRLNTVQIAATLALGAGFLFATEAPSLEQHSLAARAALAKGDTGKAKRELKLSLQENPLHAEAHFLLASVLGREGDLDQAVVGFKPYSVFSVVAVSPLAPGPFSSISSTILASSPPPC